VNEEDFVINILDAYDFLEMQSKTSDELKQISIIENLQRFIYRLSSAIDPLCY
jgi:hypothetical protein